METRSIRANEISREWFIVDAEGQTLGRIASEIAQIIRGKKKPFFTPHMDTVSYTHLTLPTKRIV